jgi:hypothetical protein
MSTKTVTEKWSDLGFLEEINSELKEKLANAYENAANFLIANKHDDLIEIYIFPILHRLAKEINVVFEPIELIEKLSKFLDKVEIHNLIDEFSCDKQYDVEAEVVLQFINSVK